MRGYTDRWAGFGCWRRAVCVRLDRTGAGLLAVVWLGWGGVGCSADVGVFGMRSIWVRFVFSSLPLDRRSLPPWRGGDVKFAHQRERAFDPVTLGIIRSFVCALSSVFLDRAEQGSRRSRVESMRSFTWRYEEQSQGTRKLSLQSIGIILFFIHLCVFLHSARIGLCADTEVPSFGNAMPLAANKKSLHSSRLMYKQNTRGAHRLRGARQS